MASVSHGYCVRMRSNKHTHTHTCDNVTQPDNLSLLESTIWHKDRVGGVCLLFFLDYDTKVDRQKIGKLISDFCRN